MEDLPAIKLSFNGLIGLVEENFSTLDTDPGLSSVNTTVISILDRANTEAYNLEHGGLNYYLTGNYTSGLTYGAGLGAQVAVTGWEFGLQDGSFKTLYLPEPVGDWTTTSSVLIDNSFKPLAIKIDYYLTGPIWRLQNFVSSAATLDPTTNSVLKVGSEDIAGNVTALNVTATTDNGWGIAYTDFLGGNSVITTGETGIALRGGFLTSSSLAVGPYYYTAGAAVTTTSGSAQIGKGYKVGFGQIKFDF